MTRPLAFIGRRSAVLPLAALAAALTWLPASAQPAARIVNDGTPTPECSLRINFDRNTDFPGYWQGSGAQRQCMPFLPTNRLVPADYRGQDYYAEEFTDARIRARWADCKKDAACAERVLLGAKPFIAAEQRDTGAIDPSGALGPDGQPDLQKIRRPAFFGAAPYAEPIARAEARTYTVEFTVPRDSFERLHLGKTDPVKLRGWYLRGQGVADASGKTARALVILNNGGSNEITGTDDPRSATSVYDPATRAYTPVKFPDGMTEESGQRFWRGFASALNEAGFDVLATDRRGNGVSSGLNGFNTAEQGNDIFRELAQLASGDGLRVRTPAGQVLSGADAARAVMDGQAVASLPVVIGGYSRGSYATAWAMHKNFVADCDYDVATPVCKPPRALPNIKGAILYGPNSSGLGYRVAGHDLIEAALRTEYNTTYYPDGAVFANIGKWPGVLIAKGQWDYVEGMEGAFEAWRRAREPKDIFVFRGPHTLSGQAPDNMRLAGERMVAFAKAAVADRKTVDGALHPANLKELLLSSPPYWEATTAPKP